MTQETFLSAYKNFSSFDGKYPKAWLVKIATNKCKNYLKKKSTQNEKTYSFENLKEIPDLSSPATKILDEEVHIRFKKILSKINEPYKNVLEMYFLENLSLKEISEKLNENYRTVQTKFYRGRNILKEKWKEEFENEY